MRAIFRMLPLIAIIAVIVMNAKTLKKNLNVVGKVQVAATSSAELQAIATVVANEFSDTRNLPVENLGEFLRENFRARGGRDRSKDVWGTEYRLGVDAAKNGFSILSAGPDTKWNTDDDLNYFQSLTEIAGKGAINAEMVTRARNAALRSGVAATPVPATNVVVRPVVPVRELPRQSVEETTRKVVEFQKKRAAGGSPQAAYDLALRYMNGDGVAKDFAEARRLLDQAIKNADSESLKQKAQTQIENLKALSSEGCSAEGFLEAASE